MSLEMSWRPKFPMRLWLKTGLWRSELGALTLFLLSIRKRVFDQNADCWLSYHSSPCHSAEDICVYWDCGRKAFLGRLSLSSTQTSDVRSSPGRWEGKMAFAFYDFETTGLVAAYNQPLQFAAILTDDAFKPLERCHILRPLTSLKSRGARFR